MSLDSSLRPPLPLAGVRVYSARTNDRVNPSARGLHEALAAAGADIVDLPLVQTDVLTPHSWPLTPHVWAAANWVCATSAEAVEALTTAPDAVAALRGAAKMVVVGANAHEAAMSRHWPIAVDIPDIAVGVGAQTVAVTAAVTEALLSRDDVAETQMVLFTSEELAEALAHGLATLGVKVHTVVVTRTVPVPGLDARMAMIMATLVPVRDGSAHLVLVTSPTAVDVLTDAIAPKKTGRFPMVCIGKQTARAARTAGFSVTVEMEYVNGQALVNQLARPRYPQNPQRPV